MAVEKTFSIIKPDAVGKNLIGKILQKFEDNDLQIVASKMVHMSKEKAEGFYGIHKDKPFFRKSNRIYNFGPSNCTSSAR